MTDIREFISGSAALESAKQASVFATLINAAVHHYDIKPADMAREFGVNPSTIARWAAGKNAPHVLVRPIIVDWIRENVESRA